MMKSRKIEKKHRICLWIATCAAMLLLGLLQTTGLAHADEVERVIRVGYFRQCGFIEEKKGTFSGYAVEYLEKIAYYTGWKYEFVEATTQECLQMLADGEVDMLCGVQYTEERAEQYAYTRIPVGYEYTTVYVGVDEKIYYEDYAALDGRTIGLIEGSFHSEAFRELTEGISYDTLYYEEEKDMMQALKVKEVDAVVMGSIHLHDGVKVIGRYNANPFYFVANKKNSTLVEEIDAVLQQIKMEAPEFEVGLTEKYYGNNLVSDGPLFTREEAEYIASCEPIKIRLLSDSIPLSYYRDSQPTGILVRYLTLLSEYSGLNIEIEMSVTSDSMDEETLHIPDGNYMMLRTERAVKKGEIAKNLVATNPILETKLSYVIRKDAIQSVGTGRKGYVLAVTSEMNYIEELMEKDTFDCVIKRYSSIESCLDAVLNGEADIAIQDAYVVSYALQSSKYSGELIEYPGENVVNKMCLLVSKEDEMLLRILNKTIRFISDSEVKSLVTREILLNPYQITLGDFVYENRQSLLISGAGLIVLFVVIAVMQHRMTNLKLRRKEYEVLQKKVQSDELTGVCNRQYFYEKAREMILCSTEEMCIVIMDISNFKVINDLYGMRIGDRLLRQMARELQKLAEGRDVLVARFTGDHFYMCMKQADFIKIDFPQKFNTFLEDMEIKVSYGVFPVGDQKEIPINSMCDRASLAVHDKEQLQTEYIRYYSDEERKRILQEQEIENEMEKALKSRQFCVFIQPKYDVETEEIVGGEALVRWKHPQKGMISPAMFIPVFEKNGFIVKLDYYVWEETCRLLSELKKQGLPVLPVSINISRVHLYGRDIKTRLLGLVEKYGLRPEDLELEITETICAEDTDIIYKRIKRLQTQGFKVAMDDFGSGYSSLNMLKEMPLDIVKMDLKFLDAKENVEKSRLILETLIRLSQKINLKVVVEGVETKEQQEFLKEIGGCQAQGYYFSKPVDCDTYTKMLQKEE
ncbi:MAG: EAL domain-containing protein [Lachnospiraceae bacterium]|nr:EAL domain-containing protein [Lachnospiraceae bacterium]